MEKDLSIFRKFGGEEHFYKAYDKMLEYWPAVESIYVETIYSRTHLLVLGPEDAQPLILLHGMVLSSTVWYKNVEELSKNYRVYCVDIPADFGKSSIKKPLKTKDDYIEFFNQLIMQLHLEEFSLLGHSFGGFLALTYALSNPTGLKKLVLLAPAGSVYALPFKFYLKAMPPAIFPSNKRTIALCNYFLAKKNKLMDIIEEDFINQLDVSFIHCFPKNQILARVFTDEELRELNLPTLFIVGEEEVIYNGAKAAKRISDLIPNVQTNVIPNAGHALNIEQPEVINKIILRFLNLN